MKSAVTAYFGVAMAVAVASLGVALMLAPLSMVIFPGSKSLAASLACPSGYVRSIVVQDIGHPEPGVTTYSSELYCVVHHGPAVVASDSWVFVGLWTIEAGAIFAVLMGILGVGKAVAFAGRRS